MSDLTVSRRISCSQDETWRQLTDAKALALWWWPARFQTTYHLNPVEGGSYRFVTADVPRIGVLELAGTFLEVLPPHRLTYTWAWASDLGHESHVEVELRSIDNVSTELTIRHTGLKDEADVANHIQGWNDCLDRLALRFS